MADHPLARLADVGFTTSGSVILRDIDLTVEAGEILGVTGANGAGKTTLLRVLATLYRPTSGGCSVLGADTRARSEDLASIRRRIALVGHSPALWPELTLRENLQLPALLRGEAPTDDPLHTVGLAGVAGLRAARASLGMQRRVEFARLLTWTPRLLLLDEPHAGLDRATRPLVDGLVRRVAGDGGAAVLVSHDPARATPAVTRRIRVVAGTLREGER